MKRMKKIQQYYYFNTTDTEKIAIFKTLNQKMFDIFSW